MNDEMNNLIILLALALILLVMIRLAADFLRNRFAPVKKVKAQLISKSRQELFSKYSGSGKNYRYVVVFAVEGGTLSFDVSEFSYRGYREKQRGTLTYRGSRLISFQ